ncbi:MAG: Gldg family protein [Planctomycetota bacterium]
MSGGTPRAKSVGRLSRLGTAVQVVVTVVLAMAAVLLVNWLAGRPGIRQRVDLTATSRNTLSTATLGVVQRLEDDVRIDILYRPMEWPITALGGEVMTRVEKLLVLLETEAAGRIDVEAVDLSDPDAWAMTQQQLRLRGFENGLVVSCGEQRTFVPLQGGLAVFDIGNPVPEGHVPPRVRQFDAERAIVEAILDVTRGEQIHAYFTFGYGEPDALDSEENANLGLLAETLEEDGFRVHRWNRLEDGPLPEDCAVLVAIGPNAGWPDEMYGELLDYLERGGRLVVAPRTRAEDLRRSDVPDLLEHFGMEVSEGRVMVPRVDARTGAVITGRRENEAHFITADLMSTHPMLAAIRAAGGGFVMPITHQVRIREQPSDGVAQHLFTSSSDSWLDAAPCDRQYQPEVDGTFGSFPLAVALVRAPMQDVPTPAGLEVEPEIRIVALGSDAVFSNASMQNPQFRTPDLARAVFNWVVDRRHRITVPVRDPDLRYLPQDRPEAMVFVIRLAQFYLPGLALLTGVLVWIVRVRGSRRLPSTSLASAGGAVHAEGGEA